MCTIDKVCAVMQCSRTSGGHSATQQAQHVRALLPSQMLIKGIRSFSPDNKAVIQFYKPLTLIVGANGAGKTVGCWGPPARRAPWVCQRPDFSPPLPCRARRPSLSASSRRVQASSPRTPAQARASSTTPR